MTDPLFIEEARYSVFPVCNVPIWDMYKKMKSCMWHVHEVDMSKDLVDWNKLSTDEAHFLKMVLAFFASSDLIVNENLVKRFIGEIKCLEAQVCYRFQAMMEDIHSEMYATLIEAYIRDSVEKDRLFNAVANYPIVAKKAAFAYKWMRSERPFAERLVAFSAVEGIFFSGSFCAIYWIKERGILPGLTISNAFISRDEGMHTDLAILIHSQLVEKCQPETLQNIIREAVDLETEFITDAIPCRLIGMNAEMMTEYIKFVANRLLTCYGVEPIYKASQPFTFMDRIGLTGKTNFFEYKPDAYGFKDMRATEAEDPYADL